MANSTTITPSQQDDCGRRTVRFAINDTAQEQPERQLRLRSPGPSAHLLLDSTHSPTWSNADNSMEAHREAFLSGTHPFITGTNRPGILRNASSHQYRPLDQYLWIEADLASLRRDREEWEHVREFYLVTNGLAPTLEDMSDADPEPTTSSTRSRNAWNGYPHPGDHM